MIVDKPASISSAGVVARLKRAVGARKVGHTGTLDPFATGLMICGINSGTRLSRFFLHERKTYLAELHLGIETDTLDCTGTPLEPSETNGDPTELTREAVESALAAFAGPQQQLPPVYSALKHEGTPLYKLARRGTPVQKPPRDIHIHDIRLLEMNLPRFSFEVACSAGTYIRTLASDLGKKLGFGAHLSALRRTETCGFLIERAVSLDKLEEAAKEGSFGEHLVSLNDAVAHLPGHAATPSLEEKVLHGRPITPEDGLDDADEGFIRLINAEKRLLAVIEHKKAEGVYDYCCVFNN